MCLKMNIDRSLIRGDELLPTFFCGHCKLLAVQPRLHSGGYEQKFCQTVFCQSCVAALQNFDFNKNYYFDAYGNKVARCPAGCSKGFCAPFFRPLDFYGKYHYDKIIIECPGCHTDFKAEDFSTHCTKCAPLRNLRPWVTSVFVNSIIPKNEFLVLRRKHWLESYESKFRILSGVNNTDGYVSSMTGDEPLTRIFLPHAADKWESKIVPVCENKVQFLARVKEAFGVDSGIDGDIVGLSHRSLLSSNDTKSFLKSLPSGTPLTLFPRRKSLSDFTLFGTWLFLESKRVGDFEPEVIVPASNLRIDEE